MLDAVKEADSDGAYSRDRVNDASALERVELPVDSAAIDSGE